MDLIHSIRSYAQQPITHQLLMSLLGGYKRPNDKIHDLLNDGIISNIKKGLYIAGPLLGANKPEPFLMANHILGPSYVSLESALSYHGLIPERVFEIASVTTKASRRFITPVGTYSYTRLPLPYYAYGIRQVRLAEDQYVMMASPEKAIFDKVICTAGVIFRSIPSVERYLLDDLRMEEESLRKLNTRMMVSWLGHAPKQTSMSMLIKMIYHL